jgi:hypothetical protein
MSKPKQKCIDCRVNAAVMPDGGSPKKTKKVCRPCHEERCRQDVEKIMALYARRLRIDQPSG